MKQRKPVWVVFATDSTQGGYTHLTLNFKLAHKAARLVGPTGYNTVGHDHSFELRFTSGNGGRNAFGEVCKPQGWFIARVTSAGLSTDVVRAIGKLVGHNQTPEAAIAALKATPVEYNSSSAKPCNRVAL